MGVWTPQVQTQLWSLHQTSYPDFHLSQWSSGSFHQLKAARGPARRCGARAPPPSPAPPSGPHLAHHPAHCHLAVTASALAYQVLCPTLAPSPVHPAASGQSFLKARRTLSAQRAGCGLRACMLGPGQLWSPLPRSLPAAWGHCTRRSHSLRSPCLVPRTDPSLPPGLCSDVTESAGDRGLQ